MTAATTSGPATCRGLRQLELIRRFQAAHCGAAFHARYGAIGTAIARREPRRDGRGRGLCLRVLLDHKRRGAAAFAPLPRSFTDMRRGATHRIPVESVRVGDWLEHARTSLGGPGFTSGFCEPHLGGTLGGWAWHDRSCSLVLITCAHVVGRRRGIVTWYDDRTRRVRRAGVVGGSIPILAGGRETVDAAFVHPDPDALGRIAWFDRIPPVRAIAAPDLMDRTRASAFRYRRWHMDVGIRTGAIDAVSLNVEIGFMWDASGATAFLCDFFMVRADHGDWGAPTDSGSLVFGRKPVGAGHRPVLGIYWGAFDAADTKPHRTIGVACRMDRVSRQLGAAPLGAQPLLAFADWLHGHRAALDFLALRRTPGQRVRFRRGRAARIVAAVARRGWARSLRAPFAAHDHQVVLALARDNGLRTLAARALGPVLRHASPDAVFAHGLTRGERAALGALFESLAELVPGLAQAMRQLHRVVNDQRYSTVGAILGGVDSDAGLGPNGARRRS